jgi:hypothetical protein
VFAISRDFDKKNVFALAFADLMRQMWLPSENQSAVSPSAFKEIVGAFAPRFTGYQYVVRLGNDV